MGAKKISEEQLGVIRHFIELGWSSWKIQCEMKKKKCIVSRRTIDRIRQGAFRVDPADSNKENSGRRSSLSKRQLTWLRKELEKPNPLAQAVLADRLNISPRQVRRYKEKFGLRTVVKPKGHEISEASREKRYRRSWPMYLHLRGDRYKKFVTSDEVWFYLKECNGQTRIQYLSRDKKRSEAEHFEKTHQSKGFMVWAAISCRGKATLRFIDPKSKVTAAYYIKEVLEPFIKNDLPKLYPNGDGVFHQDSAPAHAAKVTVDYLESRNINYITKDQWMPNSPDAAPCDFFLWGYLKSKLRRKKITTLQALKSSIRTEFKKVPQELIDRAMRAWPKRCRKIYYAKGKNIEV